MEHFLGYHNAEEHGPYFRNEKEKRSSTGIFFTAKNLLPDKLVGNKVWVIEGRQIPRQYRLVSTGLITDVVSEMRPEQYRTSEKADGLTIEFQVEEFNDPVEVTSYEWFRRLKASQRNFRYGFTRIKYPDLVKALEETWADRGTTASSPVLGDIEGVQGDKGIAQTTKKQLIDARLGQGRFRDNLEFRWDNACAVTGCGVAAVLRASHIKAWKNSTNKERLDPNNGLLLAAHIDALFDSGLVTFRDDGRMLVSKQITSAEIRRLQLGGSLLKNLTNGEKGFLRHHRENNFRDNQKGR